MDVARLNLSHGAYADHEERLPARAAGRRRDRPRRRHPRRPAGPQDPARHVRRRARSLLEPRRRASPSPPRTSPGDQTRSARRRTRACPATCRPGDRILIDDGKVALEVIEVDGPRVVTAAWSRAAWSPTTRASTCPASPSASRPCPRRTSTTCAGACSLGADMIALSFVRSADGHRRTCTRSWTRRASACRSSPRSRSRRPSSNLDEIVDGVRRHHGRPRRPRRRAAARARAARAEARRAAGPAQRQAGHRRDPDARVDDRALPARPGPRPPTSPTPSSTAPTR